MSEEESQKMQDFVEKTKKSSQEEQILKISGIMYVDELNWTVWINGAPYLEAGQYDGFSIDEVTSNEVTITKQDGTTTVMGVSSEYPEEDTDEKSKIPKEKSSKNND
jgi:hypothetical protein